MKWGFTGSQRGTDIKTILKVLDGLNLTKNDLIVTGACIGIDAQVARLVATEFPDVQQKLIVPSDMSKVDQYLIVLIDDVVLMPPKSSYRDRNERIVRESDKMIAFWTGQKAYSGTYMTINIAKRAGKLNMVIRI